MRRRKTYSAEGISTILTQTVRMDRLINDLLDVARSEAGQLELKLSQFELSRFVDDTVASIMPTATEHPIVVEKPDAPIVGEWDADRIGQVLSNLVTNAIKYSPNGTPVRIQVSRDGEMARFAVVDEGPGIDPKLLPKLFQRFYRVEGSNSGAPGLGLGLYISRLLVEAHGGHIEVSSEVGRGSTFCVDLPIALKDRPRTSMIPTTPEISPN
jgi:signal transduction histidine kinase